MTGRLAGKIAIVTGAGSGMGRAMVELFVAQGASVVAADISGAQNAVARNLGEHCVPLQVDVAKSADVKRMVDLAVERFGRLDVLCNNAGVQWFSSVVDCTEEQWDRQMAVNAKGPFLGMKYAIPRMIETGGGSIINTCSIAATKALASLGAYSASKGAVASLTRVAAVEHGRNNIRVNAILPGAVVTAMSLAVGQDALDAYAAGTPVGRPAQPIDVANLALYLASDESWFMTGALLALDGGMSL